MEMRRDDRIGGKVTDRQQSVANNDVTIKMKASIVFSMADINRIMGPNSARFVGMESEIGTLESGKRADIILQSGDPTANIYGLLTTKLTMKDGRIVIDQR